MDKAKEFLKSVNWKKTIYNLVTSKTVTAAWVTGLVTATFPPAGVWLAANPEALPALFAFLRVITTDPIIATKVVD